MGGAACRMGSVPIVIRLGSRGRQPSDSTGDVVRLLARRPRARAESVDAYVAGQVGGQRRVTAPDRPVRRLSTRAIRTRTTTRHRALRAGRISSCRCRRLWRNAESHLWAARSSAASGPLLAEAQAVVAVEAARPDRGDLWQVLGRLGFVEQRPELAEVVIVRRSRQMSSLIGSSLSSIPTCSVAQTSSNSSSLRASGSSIRSTWSWVIFLEFLLGALEFVGGDLAGLLGVSIALRASRRMLRTAMRPSSAMCLTTLTYSRRRSSVSCGK